MPPRCSRELKENVITTHEKSRTAGVSQKTYCDLIKLRQRRLQCWLGRQDNLEDGRPGYAPGTAPHRLLASEKEKIQALAEEEKYVDLSHRTLAITALDNGLVAASQTTFYRVMREINLTTFRGIYQPHRGTSTPPKREELSGPMQRLCWDISYIRMPQKWQYLFLYVVLDEWSRLVTAWRLDACQSKEVARDMLEELFMTEGILDLPEEERPVIINDRGSQMKAKTVQQMFVDLSVQQRYARPRTPNDNPYIESFFRTIKYHPSYPGKFCHAEEAEAYFEDFFAWYNTEHLHSGIGFVTPEDKHNGRADEIFSRRKNAMEQARKARLTANQGLSDFQRTNVKTAIKAENRELCIVLT